MREDFSIKKGTVTVYINILFTYMLVQIKILLFMLHPAFQSMKHEILKTLKFKTFGLIFRWNIPIPLFFRLSERKVLNPNGRICQTIVRNVCMLVILEFLSPTVHTNICRSLEYLLKVAYFTAF